MGYQLFGTDLGDFLVDSPEAEKTLFRTPKGDITFEEQQLNHGLSIIQAKYSMQEDLNIFGKGDASLLEIQFNLSHQDIHFHSQGKSQITKAFSGNIAFLAPEENQAAIDFRKNNAYHTFDVHIPCSILQKYAGESKALDGFLAHIEANRSSKLSPHGLATNTSLLQCIQAIKQCNFEGLSRRIYLESKVYELIALLYEGSNQAREIKLSQADIERMHRAAFHIQENLDQPITILELAKLVGVNQTKLKDGFKQIFGQTVFNYLQELRMGKAKEYLLHTNLSIQEIAHLLGYQSMSNFSAAFKKVQQVSPLQLRNRK